MCCTFVSCGMGQDVWFLWTAPCFGPARVQSCGSQIDTKIAVYRTPCPPSDQTIVACNDDSCGLQSVVNWEAIAGEQYLIRIGTFIGAPGGAGEFRASCGSCVCDFNHNGVVNSEDFFNFLACFFDEFCPDADINDDGERDTQDLFAFLACHLVPPPACE